MPACWGLRCDCDAVVPDLATAPDQAPPTEAASAVPSRRAWRHRLLIGVVVLAVAVAVVWVAAPGTMVRLAPVSLQFGDGAPAAVVDGFGGPQGTYVVGYEHDTYVDVDVLLHNAGPIGVAVEQVRLDMQHAPLLVPADSTAPGGIPSGGHGVAGVELRFDNCEAYHEREAMLVEAVEVEATVLGRTVVERVALDRPLMVRSPMLWQCPDRTIDRSDDRRPDGAFSRDAP